MKVFLQRLLASFSRRIIAKYKPKIVGITGSVGKTSAKEAVFLVVSQTFKARKSEKNFNNEFGVPFTVLGVDSPGRSPVKWLGVILKAVSLVLFTHKYPQVLVLEMGIDRPGDMDYLLSIVHPDIAVITTIGLSHYEFFHDAAAIEEEKGKLAKAVSGNDVLIVNADNEVALRQSNKAQGKVLTYSIRNQADIMIADIKESLEGKYNTTFSVVTPHKQFDGQVNAIGSVHLSALAAAISVAEVLNIDTDSIKKGLIQYKPTPGRLNIISGIKHTTIIDDSYNASPASMAEALALLARLPASSKMAVLGDMLELGAQSDPAHERAGKTVAELSPDYLITIGASGKIIAEAARQNGMNSEKIISFDTSDEARKTVQDLLQPESLVLIKGSQGKRMEKITAEIMAEPMRAHELLCRQHGKWLES